VNAKRFFLIVLAVCVLLLACSAVFVAAVDPLLTGGMDEGDTALFLNERYEMAGLIRNQEYSNVVVGTSLVANYRASWFTKGLGAETLKITFPNGQITEFDAALELAYRSRGALDHVFFGLDPNILVSAEKDAALPDYLYNKSVLDDLQAYLSADGIALAVGTVMARAQGQGIPLDDAYLLDKEQKFGEKYAKAFYPRPETVSDTKLAKDAYRDVCDENLAVIARWIETHPDTQFTIWFPPYSILYWDKMDREGKTDAMLWAVEYATARLLEYENVNVHCFLIGTAQISDLREYTDHIHCSVKVTEWMTEEMLAGRWKFTKENYQIRLDELREFVANYDYESLFVTDG